ncbi:2-hydroxyacid dehydrogenase [Zhihengliuella alba]|uniref:2-hydroxyacid dehydrogenase n=1 Tax=Zhihengliuella alba TaxID=547018 RepID=A0ABP7E2L9_9MICC
MSPEKAPKTTVLAAGDRFIRPATFEAALRREVGAPLEISTLELPWPDEPFGDVGTVSEASGTEDQLIEALDGVDAIVTQLAPMSRRVLEASASLRFIGVSRGGPVNIDLAAATERGITVANVPGRNGIATAELTLTLLLAALRQLPAAHGSLLEGRWRGDLYRADQVGTEVNGSTIGLVGAGAVGGHVAQVLVAMGARVLVFDPYLAPERVSPGIELVDLDRLVAESHVVSLHARVTAETQNLFSAERIAAMRPGAILVNAARGPLMDYDAAAEALESGRLGGVALDVYPAEPADTDHRLFELARAGANVVLTPHIAGASVETAERAATGVAVDLGNFLAGRPLAHAVALPAGAGA